MKHRVAMFSGGISSYLAAKRSAETDGLEGLTLLFADTKMEDEDLYRFVKEAAADVGAEFVTLADGRDVWEVFHDVRFMGNTRADPCSRILKRELCRNWMEKNRDPETCSIVVGLDFTEMHRVEGFSRRMAPWRIEAPMLEPPLMTPAQKSKAVEAAGIAVPRLYKMGFPHNNCGGFCVKQGRAGFARLHRELPERYAYHEKKEEDLRQHLGKDIAVLRDRRGGETKPLTLKVFRENFIESGQLSMDDLYDEGGCGCFVDED